MKKNIKKLFALTMALCLVFALAASASAASNASNGSTIRSLAYNICTISTIWGATRAFPLLPNSTAASSS